MKSPYRFAQLLCCMLVITPLTLGCGGGKSASTDNDSTASQSTATSNQTASNQATGATSEPSLANATMVQEGSTTEAAESVAIFLDSLRRGNEQAANAVLTTQARAALQQTSFEMRPLGTPEGMYKIGRVSFPYEEKNVALVECLWQEPTAVGAPAISMDIVCEVRQESEGWRISGIAITIPDSEETVVLDFEDAAALQATLNAATGQPAPSTQNTAAAQSGPTGLPGNLPSSPQGQSQAQLPAAQLPAYPTDGFNPSQQSQPSQQGEAPQQIAMPPLPGSNINR